MRTMLLIVSVAAVALQTPAPYLITHTYNVGGDGSWDYIVPDPASHRLFIGRQDRVMVVSEDNGSLLGAVTGIVYQRETGDAIGARVGNLARGALAQVFHFRQRAQHLVARLRRFLGQRLDRPFLGIVGHDVGF